jgi:hypothetical protein
MNATPDDVIQIVREEFGEENRSVKKLLCRVRPQIRFSSI